jgi:hypothetical protein
MKYTALLVSAIATSLTTFVNAGPNLTPAVYNFAIDVGYIGEATEVQDGCIPNGTHNLLRFDFYSKNIGDADFIAGKPITRPDLFYYHLSHHHFHMREFNQYRLISANGNLVIPSTKPGFCLADVVELIPNAAPQQFSLTCAQNAVMGITAGWADVYTADLTCQYLVIDDIADGDYVLVVATNAARKVPEDTFDDNTVSVGLHIQSTWVWTTTIPPGFNYSVTQAVATTSSSVQIAAVVSPTSTAVTSTSVPVSQTGVAPALNATTGAVPSSQQTSAAAKVSFVRELFMAISVGLALMLCWNT